MKRTISRIAVALTIVTCCAARLARASEPAGYELFDHTPVESFHVVDVKYDVVQSAMRDGYRPIAFELTSYDSSDDSEDWKFSVAFIRSAGVYQRDSLFLWNYTEQAMHDLQEFAIENDWWHWVPLDVKRQWVRNRSGDYERRYAFIFAENPEGREWRWVLHGTEDDCLDLHNNGWRSVAMTIENDSLTENPLLRYDAAFVENNSDNLVVSTFMRCNGDDIVGWGKAGWQVIRCQRISGWDPDNDYNAVFVNTGNSFWIPGNDGSYPKIESTYGRMIDLRGVPDLSLATFLYEY